MSSLRDKDRAKDTVMYRDTLDPVCKARYFDKLRVIDNKDPYQMLKSEWSKDMSTWPDVSVTDIIMYLVHSTSAYTLDQLKAYKSLQSYNYFVSGWVLDIGHNVINGNSVLLGKVKHSQRMNDSFLQPWLIIEKNGCVVSGHCTCMACIGEVCSYVGALLFAIEASVNIRDSKTVTDEKCYWLLPSSVPKIQYNTIREIDFTSAKTKKRQLDEAIRCQQATPAAKQRRLPTVSKPTKEEMAIFFATEWGCVHEKDAKNQYINSMKTEHENFQWKESGLIIDTSNPFMGATPDGMASCDCCGSILVEIKCPYCHKHETINENVDCLEKIDGNLSLKKSHSYYYQVQCQLLVSDKEFCDFVIWTEKDFFTQRIPYDEQFCSEMVELFFKKVVLPELVGKLYSRQAAVVPSEPETIPITDISSNIANVSNTADAAPVSTTTDIIICFCQTVYKETDDVIGCDNENCPYVWVHFVCAGIKRVPKGKWFCKLCKKNR